jgi:hypothetical protein
MPNMNQNRIMDEFSGKSFSSARGRRPAVSPARIQSTRPKLQFMAAVESADI